MKVNYRTPLSEMQLRSLMVKSATLIERLAEELCLETEAVDSELYTFCRLSTQVTFEADEVDFKQAKATDTPDEIAEHFRRYVHSKCMDVIDAVQKELYGLDRPIDPATGPVTPDPKAKS